MRPNIFSCRSLHPKKLKIPGWNPNPLLSQKKIGFGFYPSKRAGIKRYPEERNN
ncbi:hypothetical protein LEP1GSC036_1100 [Leptospira weilii str. 2006001853]|uniref:Uncharacterized protein n=3 Tax=Leptospira weilii TaxID=28184 RepID=A0A828Z0K6_9LEPT|nr:hypothetical protein LEP1GSC036_1100 [Leptospira weilii str. 2006001853]EMJ60540.1 hypothetical protein LEP1GSC051_0856 [Leptospira sp. P2653]EMM70716.1 hypothetical protein LEP1GSC038_1305 [Leptospira weilii str. 2006001855]EMN92300.1 hypothetical protein LEP1GSC108_2738 [Leptospira weilii str. UI 13098]